MVPALRERDDDITLLCGYFVERCRQKLGIKNLSLSPTSLSLLKQYDWPGNIRELEHALHRAAVLAKAQAVNDLPQILPQHFDIPGQAQKSKAQLPGTVSSPFQGLLTGSLKDVTDEFQAQYIQHALAENHGQWAATARQLKVDSGNLHRLAKRLGLKK